MKLPSPSSPTIAASSRPARSHASVVLLLLLPFAHAAETTPAGSPSVVAVTAVVRQDLAKELAVQAEFKPYQEVDLHAKVAGFLQQVKCDIGDTVKAGDVIAVLEVPELREDLARGEAVVKRAEAGYKDAHLNFTRLANVRRTQPELVAQQDLDAAEAKDAIASAALAEAQADREKVRAMESYTRIIAPFSGVITKRYADPGALIQAGTASNTQALPIVRLSQSDRLRLSFPISVAYAGAVKVGDEAAVDLGPRQKSLPTRIARLSGRVSTETRTMMGEADIANPDLALIPGMYATLRLKVDRRAQVLTIPVEAVSGSKQATAFVVNADLKIEERPLKLGIETASSHEVLSGLREGELVVLGSRTQFQAGQKVTTKLIQPAATP